MGKVLHIKDAYFKIPDKCKDDFEKHHAADSFGNQSQLVQFDLSTIGYKNNTTYSHGTGFCKRCGHWIADLHKIGKQCVNDAAEKHGNYHKSTGDFFHKFKKENKLIVFFSSIFNFYN